jgi:hypothetical protein
MGEQMTLTDSLVALAEQNHYGIAFLLAYGTTWLCCGVLWRVLDPGRAALATLFQGMIAFPVALAFFFLTGAMGQERPVDDSITQLSTLIGASQLLGLPFLIYLHATRRYVLVPFAFVAICAMHFVLYAWLYQTCLYVLMSVTIAIGGMVLMLIRTDGATESGLASRVCIFTGLTMYATSGGLTYL